MKLLQGPHRLVLCDIRLLVTRSLSQLPTAYGDVLASESMAVSSQWWLGLVVTSFVASVKLLYIQPGVSTEMADRLWVYRLGM